MAAVTPKELAEGVSAVFLGTLPVCHGPSRVNIKEISWDARRANPSVAAHAGVPLANFQSFQSSVNTRITSVASVLPDSGVNRAVEMQYGAQVVTFIVSGKEAVHIQVVGIEDLSKLDRLRREKLNRGRENSSSAVAIYAIVNHRKKGPRS